MILYNRVEDYTSLNDFSSREYVDTRELVELRDKIVEATEIHAENGHPSVEDDQAAEEHIDLCSDCTAEAAELQDAIVSVLNELGHESEYGMTMIPESEFEDYARDFASDIGAIDDDAGWPNVHLDWKAAAEDLAQDYTSVTFAGIDYLVR